MKRNADTPSSTGHEANASEDAEKIRNAIAGNLGLRLALAIVNRESYGQNLMELADSLTADVMRALK